MSNLSKPVIGIISGLIGFGVGIGASVLLHKKKHTDTIVINGDENLSMAVLLLILDRCIVMDEGDIDYIRQKWMEYVETYKDATDKQEFIDMLNDIRDKYGWDFNKGYIPEKAAESQN